MIKKMHSDNSTNLASEKISDVTLMSIALLFCFNTLVVLVYFIRRRVRLSFEIRRIPAYQLVRQEYKNYFMNLRTTIKITNLIILILILEIIENLFVTLTTLEYVSQILLGVNYIFGFYVYASKLLGVIRLMYVPLLSLVMNFLWLVYRNYEYKYTMIRWTVYIVVRGLVAGISIQSIIYMSNEYRLLAYMMLSVILISFFAFDFIQYVYYSKRFYSHLKSREKEIRLFYFDREAYIQSKNIRMHFCIATTLVASALFISTLAYSLFAITKIVDVIVMIFDRQDYQVVYDVSIPLEVDVLVPMTAVYKFLFNLNYLYIIVVIVYKSIRGRIKLYNINKHIKPIVQEYHDTVYNFNL